MAKKLGEFATPNENFMSAPTALPNVATKQFEIKPYFATVVQQNQFWGSTFKDVGMHLHTFTELCDMQHIKHYEPDTSKLLYFLII